MANLVLNYSFTPKVHFPQKNNYHHLCLSSNPHHPTTFQTNPWSWSLDIRLYNFGPNWVQIVHLPVFGKIDCYYCLATVFQNYNISKKYSKSNLWDRRCAEGWSRLSASYFPKREFFGNVDQHCFGITIVSHHARSFQKNCHRTDHVKVA